MLREVCADLEVNCIASRRECHEDEWLVARLTQMVADLRNDEDEAWIEEAVSAYWNQDGAGGREFLARTIRDAHRARRRAGGAS